MKQRWLWLLGMVLLAAAPAKAQITSVSATIMDPNGVLYVNCTWSVVFVGQNTQPGAGPYQPAPLLVGQEGVCDSHAVLNVQLVDNVNTVRPVPSQWNFSICSQPYTNPAAIYCQSNMLVTITGQSMNLTSFFQPRMPILPPGGGGGGTGGTAVTINGTQAVPNFLNFNNTVPIPPAGATNVIWQLNGNLVSAYVPSGGGGGGGLTVNGTAVTGVGNLNDSIPAPGLYGLNVRWQLSQGNQISAQIFGDGNPSHCFLGNGQFAPCPSPGGTVNGATAGGGLVQTGTTLGMLTTCSSGQYLSWSGSAWTCTTPAAGGGGIPSVTSVLAGNGSGSAVGTGVLASSGVVSAQVLTASGLTGTNPYTVPNASVEWFPSGGYGVTAPNGAAFFFGHGSGSAAAQNGGVVLAGGNTTPGGATDQAYLSCFPTGCNFLVPMTVNGATVGMTWPLGSAGIPNYNGSSGWGTSYNASNQIPSTFISTLNQSTTGNAATATALAANPVICPAGQLAAGILANGNSTGCATGGGGGSGTVNSGTPSHFAIYTAPTAVSSSSTLDDSVTTAATVTSTEPIAAPQFNLTGTGGPAMTGSGGNLPTLAAGQGGIGIGPGSIPLINPNGTGWHTIAEVAINGANLTANLANFNGSTPAIPTNAHGIAFQTDGTSNISAYLLGSGNATDCFLGTGAFGPCPGGAGGMVWPAQAGIPNYSGSSTWLPASYGPSNPIPANFITNPLNQNTTGTAGSAAAITSSGTANQVWAMNSAGSSQGWTTLATGGTGTVSPNNGSANAVAYYPASGGATTVSPTTMLYNNSSGALTLTGTSGGTATMTPPATGTGSLVMGNALAMPTAACSSGTPSLNAGSSYGMTWSNSTTVSLCGGSAELMRVVGTSSLAFGPTSLTFGAAIGTPDLGINRANPNILSVNTTAGGNELGYVRSANSCAVAAPVTFTTGASICAQTLPAAAKNWITHCVIPWQFTAGSGSTSVTFTVSAPTTVTATTWFSGVSWNPAGTGSGLGTPMTAGGGSATLSLGSLTIATSQPYFLTIDGVIAMPAAGGAVSILAVTSSGTGQIMAGAYCRFE